MPDALITLLHDKGLSDRAIALIVYQAPTSEGIVEEIAARRRAMGLSPNPLRSCPVLGGAVCPCCRTRLREIDKLVRADLKLRPRRTRIVYRDRTAPPARTHIPYVRPEWARRRRPPS